MEDLLLPCLNKELFGMDCYGCGGQRALLMVFKGNFKAAFNLFPAIYPILVLLGFVFLNLFVKFKFDYIIKISLILFTAGIILISYIFKILTFLPNH
ncbi:DUF2752 domain-containing protein [Antarcticibacterium arcticum]|uniref:DUF2752 domain-containing protein n=1 Tax=Antarcticibacterium arcticum TaxID=2585771 RepID=A0A5B8YLY7_9FLAO|nr:DUF2752 domain-containing protein [Antarcticibacterium arcticum]QED36759.1 DUF2752 domain-containing protein [Antarcticibacterium arcticum]